MAGTVDKVLITGGTGTWGRALTSYLLENTQSSIVCFSRNELSQVLMQREFPRDRIKFTIGDVRDLSALSAACYGVDKVYHLAALKHVPICESNVGEALKTNLQGTVNVVEACRVNGVKCLVDISTDKAVDPCNTYGYTKALAEKIVLQASTPSLVIRSGNVLGSNGSVVPLFIDQIKRGGPVTITSKEMTRFFATIQYTIEKVVLAANKFTEGNNLISISSNSCYIEHIVQVLMKHYGEVKVVESGIRLGEKIHETLISTNESYADIGEGFLKVAPGKSEGYSSGQFTTGLEEIEAMLAGGGFL